MRGKNICAKEAKREQTNERGFFGFILICSKRRRTRTEWSVTSDALSLLRLFHAMMAKFIGSFDSIVTGRPADHLQTEKHHSYE